jgi:hypothetical protein
MLPPVLIGRDDSDERALGPAIASPRPVVVVRDLRPQRMVPVALTRVERVGHD